MLQSKAVNLNIQSSEKENHKNFSSLKKIFKQRYFFFKKFIFFIK